MRWLKTFGLLVLILLWSVMLLRLSFFGPVFGMLSLLFIVSLACVGEGNRLVWLMVFPVVSGLLTVASGLLLAAIPEALRLVRSFLMFALMPVLPAAVLWLAVRFKGHRARRPAG